MGRRGGRGGKSSRGRSSRGRSKSRSRSRSSSKSRSSSRRKSSAKSRSSASRGRPAKKRSTTRTRRVSVTRSAPARRAARRTSRATPRLTRRTVLRRPVKTVKPRLTGGRISTKVRTPTNIRTATWTPSRLAPVALRGQPPVRSLQPQSLGSLLNGGSGQQVKVTWSSGNTRTMRLSTAAIQRYQKAGLKVTPVAQFYSTNATPQIPRIVNQSAAWSDRPPKQLHVNAPMYAKPNTRTNSNFGGLGANPWNPIEALSGLFGMAPQERPESQWLPQQSSNIINPDRPTYTAMTTGLQQAAAYQESPQSFVQDMTGGSAYNPTGFSAGETVQSWLSNQWVIIGGLAIGALVVLKLVLGGGQKVVYR